MSIKNLGLATIEEKKSAGAALPPSRKQFMFAATVAMRQYFHSILSGKTEPPPDEKYRFEINEITLQRYGITETVLFGARVVSLKSGLPTEHIAFGADID